MAQAMPQFLQKPLVFDIVGQTLTFVRRLEEQIGTPERFPERCPLVPENEPLGTAYRHLLYGNDRTIFKIVGSRVITLRVLHGARLLDTGILEGLEKNESMGSNFCP